MKKNTYLQPDKKWKMKTKNFYFSIINICEDISEYENHILLNTCHNLNRFLEAKKILDREGVILVSKTGQVKKHPAIEVEKIAWAGFLAGIRALKIKEDSEPIKKIGRPLRR